MARKAMREELVSRSRTLKAASRAIRQALRARRARSSGPPNFCSADFESAADFATDFAECARASVATSTASALRDSVVLRGIKVQSEKSRKHYARDRGRAKQAV